MNKKGFASIYMVYSFFLVFIAMMLSVLMINTYKKNFLNHLKNDIKDGLESYVLEEIPINIEENNQEILDNPNL